MSKRTSAAAREELHHRPQTLKPTGNEKFWKWTHDALRSTAQLSYSGVRCKFFSWLASQLGGFRPAFPPLFHFWLLNCSFSMIIIRVSSHLPTSLTVIWPFKSCASVEICRLVKNQKKQKCGLLMAFLLCMYAEDSLKCVNSKNTQWFSSRKKQQNGLLKNRPDSDAFD